MFGAEGRGGAGFRALSFYLQFANAASKYYTWNDDYQSDLDSFAQGKTAMVFGYHRDWVSLKKKSPFLNMGLARMPQPEGREKDIDYPDYLGLTVSRKSKFPNWAWDFVVYATTNKEAQETYYSRVKQPPALRVMISELENDPEMGVFARQALTARSWVRVDGEAVNQIFGEAIASVLSGQISPDKALVQSQEKVSQVLRQKN